MIDTNIETKKKLLPVFIEMIQKQTIEGAAKYGLTEEKEWTDMISNIFGLDYFFMNVMKYMGRIRRNDPRAEVDHAKMATYIFLRWCKQYGANYLNEIVEPPQSVSLDNPDPNMLSSQDSER